MKKVLLTMAAVVFGGMCQATEWTDKDGRKVEAELLAMDANGLRVKLKNGNKATIKKEVLADGEWEKAEALMKEIKEKSAGADTAEPWMLARTVSTGTDRTKLWETSWGSHDTVIDQTRTVEVQLRSRSDADRKFVVEAIWLGSSPNGPQTKITGIMGIIRTEITLKARDTMELRAPMSYSSRETVYRALGVRFVSGSRYGGWLMRLVDVELKKVVAEQANLNGNLEWSKQVPVQGAQE